MGWHPPWGTEWLDRESAFLPLVSTGWKSFNHLSPDIYSDQLSNSVFLKLSQSAEYFTSEITRVNSLVIMLKGVFFVESLRTPFKRYELPWMICESTKKKNIILGVTLALDSKLVFLCVFICRSVMGHTTQSEGPPFWFSPSEEEFVSYDIVLPWNVLNEASDGPGSMESEYW